MRQPSIFLLVLELPKEIRNTVDNNRKIEHFSKIMKQLPKITNVSYNNRFILFFNPKYTNISFVKILELLNWYDHTLTHKILIESYISIQNNENNEEHISIHPPPPLII